MAASDVFRGHVPGIVEALARTGDVRGVFDVMEAVVEKRAQVWGDERALIITELSEPFVHFWIATGEMEPVVALSRRILAWAAELGYTRATLTGRRGWVRALQGEGWSERAVLMEKAIDG